MIEVKELGEPEHWTTEEPKLFWYEKEYVCEKTGCAEEELPDFPPGFPPGRHWHMGTFFMDFSRLPYRSEYGLRLALGLIQPKTTETSIDKEALKERVEIGTLIDAFCEGVRHYGDRIVARCPIHADRTASLSASKQKKLWHCFGCGEGGDAFSLIMKIKQCSFKEAVKILDSMV